MAPLRRQSLVVVEERLLVARRRIADLERQLELAAMRDPVTGLASLAAFERRLEGEVERSRRHSRSLTLAVVDIDGFRSINAAHGRAEGDRVLKRVGELLGDVLRASDIVSRVGADEFRVLLTETQRPDAAGCMERVLHALEDLGEGGPTPSVCASIGIAEYRKPLTAQQLVASAASACDRARSRGGGRVEAARLERRAHARAFAEGQDPHHDVISGLAEALLERDRYTGEHSESVVQLVDAVARGLGLDTQEVAWIRAAALLHDIGKVAIPDDILRKPGKLDDDEWQLMREHPVIGERILRAVPGMGGVARIVRHEHERWDGSGYPDGLEGERIPIGSRVILACDAYHAMTSDRPYREAMPHEQAIRELYAHAGRQFDPDVTQQLIGSLYGQRQRGVG